MGMPFGAACQSFQSGQSVLTTANCAGLRQDRPVSPPCRNDALEQIRMILSNVSLPGCGRRLGDVRFHPIAASRAPGWKGSQPVFLA